MSNYITGNPVFSRFFQNLPDYPHCTDKLEAGCRQAPKHVAIKRRYIQLNKPNYSHTYLTLDCDYEGSSLSWYDYDLPTPTFVVINPENGHSHICHELTTPVHLGSNASQKAVRYLDVIRKGYIKALDADPSFTEFLSKNPLSKSWHVLSCNVTYDLDRLAEPLREISTDELLSIPLEEFDERIREYLIPLYEKRKKKKPPLISTNPDESLFVFDNTRGYMYSITPDYNRSQLLYDKAEAYIRELNADFSLNLPESHIRFNAKSIAKFCWTHRDEFIAKRLAFSERQRERAYLSHKARKRNTATKIRSAQHKLRKEGVPITKSAIAEVSGVSTRSLSERRLKTDPSEAFRAGAHQAAEIKRAATEAKIKQAFEQALRDGIKPTQKNVASLADVSLRTVKTYWKKIKA
jgi:hypothetical protein